MYLQFISFFHTDMTQVVEILPHDLYDEILPFLHCQYHLCQDNSNHDADYVEPGHFGPRTLKLKNTAVAPLTNMV